MRLRKLLRVARWETTKGVNGIDRRVAVLIIATLLVAVAAVPALAATGFALDEGIYRVGVADGHPLHSPATNDSTFDVHDPSVEAFENGELELLVQGDRIRYRSTDKGRAALATLRETTAQYNDALMRFETNQTAANPVSVTLRFAERGSATTDEKSRDGSDGGGSSDGGQTSSDGGGGAASGGGSSSGSGGNDGGGGPPTTGSGDGGFGGGDSGGLPSLDIFGSETTTSSPSDITPPFPFDSLVLAFLFVLPLNFAVQAYGSTMLKERLNRRGELLLVAPLSRSDIIAGKTLPYLVASLAVLSVIAFALPGGGLLSLAGVVPLTLLFLAVTFLAAMMARSFKELTFLTVAITVGLTSFAFVPAIFTEIEGIALISPLTLVVRDLTGESVTAIQVLFATLPATATAAVCYGFGVGLYREEDMFTQRAVPLKVLDALAGRIKRARSLVLVTALVVPFVFVAELLGVAALFALPTSVSIPAVLVVVVIIEEVAKFVPILAGFEHARYPRTLRGATLAGVASGTGFFIGEKLMLVVQFVGLPQQQVGAAAFGPSVANVSPAIALVLLFVPLVLHSVTATISAVGATRGRTGWLLGLATAMLVHLAYNAVILTGVGAL
ncbi:MAG: PrsW family intramembrane metalloprotease [Halobacteriales archaeon]|nr:PrsW family intramembrane metalloprotease [Halobacteriales archaeon]